MAWYCNQNQSLAPQGLLPQMVMSGPIVVAVLLSDIIQSRIQSLRPSTVHCVCHTTLDLVKLDVDRRWICICVSPPWRVGTRITASRPGPSDLVGQEGEGETEAEGGGVEVGRYHR